MKALEVDVRYEWKHHRNGRRHWYERKWSNIWGIGLELQSPERTSVVGTVTLCADQDSEHYNRWFAVVYESNRRVPPAVYAKSDPLMSLTDAKAWVETVERMNR